MIKLFYPTPLVIGAAMRKYPVPILWFLVIFNISPSLYADKKVYQARKVNSDLLKIDGKLNESIWQDENWSGDFSQWEPYNGEVASSDTKFNIGYDNDNLYLAVCALDSESNKIVKRKTRRDELDGDRIEIQLDSYHDQKTAFVFQVNAAGSKGDGVISEDNKEIDLSWDPVWDAATSVHDECWTVEIRIPFNQLRFGNSDEQVWGLQIERLKYHNQEYSTWQPVPKDNPGWVSSYGELRGIQNIKPSRRIEIIPYMVSKLNSSSQNMLNPLYSRTEKSLNGGIDSKLGITNDINLDVTINPDFGQVEADPSVVNLTAYETFYPEKRPFFIEGSNIFNFSILSKFRDNGDDELLLFHSRRIGRKPVYVPQTGENEFVKMPENTSILTAMKLSGKTKDGLSIGVLEAVTDKEKADFGNKDEKSQVEVEPRTNYFIGRLQRDFDKGNTIVGGMFTATNRKIDNSDLNFLNDAAYTGGFDFQKLWKDKTYRLSFKAIFSQIQGTKEAITLAQTSSRRYFQRPDADHLHFDSEKTSLAGHGGMVTFEKRGKGHWSYSSNLSWNSPGLELNDVGYMRVADKFLLFSDVSYKHWQPIGLFNEITISGYKWDVWNFGQEKLNSGLTLGLDLRFKNFWTLSSFWELIDEELDVNALRGGPALRLPSQWFHVTRVTTDNRKNLVFSFYHHDHFGKYNDMLMNYSSIGIDWKPNKSFQFSFKPGYYIDKYNLQFVNKVLLGNDSRYVLGRIKLDRFSLTTRIYYSVNSKLTIQYYAQPFLSSGNYSHFKYATNTRAESYMDRFHEYSAGEIAYEKASNIYNIDENKDGVTDYSFTNPNFNFFQFRSNLVIRWEYGHGSTLFLVWSQDRTGFDSIGEFHLLDNADSLFGIKPDNVFLVKISKWLSI